MWLGRRMSRPTQDLTPASLEPSLTHQLLSPFPAPKCIVVTFTLCRAQASFTLGPPISQPHIDRRTNHITIAFTHAPPRPACVSSASKKPKNTSSPTASWTGTTRAAAPRTSRSAGTRAPKSCTRSPRGPQHPTSPCPRPNPSPFPLPNPSPSSSNRPPRPSPRPHRLRHRPLTTAQRTTSKCRRAAPSRRARARRHDPSTCTARGSSGGSARRGRSMIIIDMWSRRGARVRWGMRGVGVARGV